MRILIVMLFLLSGCVESLPLDDDIAKSKPDRITTIECDDGWNMCIYCVDGKEYLAKYRGGIVPLNKPCEVK